MALHSLLVWRECTVESTTNRSPGVAISQQWRRWEGGEPDAGEDVGVLGTFLP